MATRTDLGFETDFAATPEDARSDRGGGWLIYAAIMLGFAATYNVIDGLLALANSKVYTANATYVFSDLRTWGWIVLLLGVLEGIAAFTALQRRNIPSRLLVFPDENHWVLKPKNSIQWYDEVFGWMRRWMGGGVPPAAPESPSGRPERGK